VAKLFCQCCQHWQIATRSGCSLVGSLNTAVDLRAVHVKCLRDRLRAFQRKSSFLLWNFSIPGLYVETFYYYMSVFGRTSCGGTVFIQRLTDALTSLYLGGPTLTGFLACLGDTTAKAR
jgi:hypothetical protein